MKRIILLIVAVAVAVIASKLLVDNVLGLDSEAWVSRWLAGAGTWSAVTVVTLLAVDLFLPVPSSLVMILSGAAFGPVLGTVFSLVGSIGGEWVGFELARRYGRDATRRISSDADLAAVDRLFATYGAGAIVVTRALPVMMETTSVAAGLSSMSRRTFLSASVIGTVPVAAVYAYSGSLSLDTGSIVPAAVILVAMTGGAYLWWKARLKTVTIPSSTDASHG